jgi:hypothetical protein
VPPISILIKAAVGPSQRKTLYLESPPKIECSVLSAGVSGRVLASPQIFLFSDSQQNPARGPGDQLPLKH